MTRTVWEEDLWKSDARLPSRAWTEGHPRVRETTRLYYADGEPLWPWWLHSLAPLDLAREWLPLPADHESAWLVRNGKVRHGLVDLATLQVVAWRPRSSSNAYQPRTHRPPP